MRIVIEFDSQNQPEIKVTQDNTSVDTISPKTSSSQPGAVDGGAAKMGSAEPIKSATMLSGQDPASAISASFDKSSAESAGAAPGNETVG